MSYDERFFTLPPILFPLAFSTRKQWCSSWGSIILGERGEIMPLDVPFVQILGPFLENHAE
ncbi:15320_t:CDS:2 [Acaulospora morrowiae]|uniref:15320_t:CDS:1 n=1 Tax=Acaulospora morrowiae TaxID=94023 RepID=A0A9N9A2V3_9GLOM|nr:15320_t:CDS:2 [Acaulospora morrowiae]